MGETRFHPSLIVCFSISAGSCPFPLSVIRQLAERKADCCVHMVNLITLGIAVTSFLGLAYIVAMKIPVLLQLSSRDTRAEDEASATALVKEYALNTRVGKFFARPEYVMQKILSTIRIVALRIEHAASTSLEHIRKQTKDKQTRFSQQYWTRLRSKK